MNISSGVLKVQYKRADGSWGAARMVPRWRAEKCIGEKACASLRESRTDEVVSRYARYTWHTFNIKTNNSNL